MSHRQQREQRRRARFDQLCVGFNQARKDAVAFWSLLRRIADSPIRVWDVAKAASADQTLDDAESFMVAQAAAPQLVRLSRANDRKRDEHAVWERRQPVR